MYLDAQGRLRGMLLSWTSLGGKDALRASLRRKIMVATGRFAGSGSTGERDRAAGATMMASGKLRRICKLINAATLHDGGWASAL